MARFSQGEAVVEFDDSSSFLTDYSVEVISVTLDITADNSQYATLGSDWKYGVSGKKGFAGQIVVPRDTSATSAYQILRAKTAAFSMSISTPDDAIGSTNYAGEILITGESSPSDASASGNHAQATFTYIGDGALTVTTISP